MRIRILDRIKEAIVGTPESKGIVTDLLKVYWKETEKPPIDRRDYMKLYKENPTVKFAVDIEVSDAVGAGFLVDTDQEEAKRIIDNFAKQVNLDRVIKLCVRDMIVTGDGIAEKIFNEEKVVKRTWSDPYRYTESKEVIVPSEGAKLVGLKWLPSFTLEVARTSTGTIKYWKQAVGTKSVTFGAEKILDFKWNECGLDAYGTSEIRPVYDLMKDLDRIRDDFVKIIRRYASPPIIWTGVGLGKEQLEQHKMMIETKKPGEDIYLNTDLLKAQPLELDPRGRFENYYMQLVDAAILGLGVPSLIMLSRATRASSLAIIQQYRVKIQSIQQMLKRIIEAEIFTPLIRQANANLEVPKLRWKGAVSIELILELFKYGIVNPKQALAMLRKQGIAIPLEEAEAEEVG